MRSAALAQRAPNPFRFTAAVEHAVNHGFLSGAAVMGGNYLPPPGNLFTNGGMRSTNIIGFATIPAGANSAAVSIFPIDDNIGSGAANVRMTLLLASFVDIRPWPIAARSSWSMLGNAPLSCPTLAGVPDARPEPERRNAEVSNSIAAVVPMALPPARMPPRPRSPVPSTPSRRR